MTDNWDCPKGEDEGINLDGINDHDGGLNNEDNCQMPLKMRLMDRLFRIANKRRIPSRRDY